MESRYTNYQLYITLHYSCKTKHNFHKSYSIFNSVPISILGTSASSKYNVQIVQLRDYRQTLR